MRTKPGQHGKLMRGLKAAGDAPKATTPTPLGSRFGRLFPKSDVSFSDSALNKLGTAMVSGFDAPKDSPDGEESGIPALYTYFGQFIDHDITFDPTSSFQKTKDAAATIDYRTPAFDLDNVYGRGPGDQPYLYQPDGLSFQLGDPLTMGSNEGARDLQRNGNGRALIGDPRNDENTIVSQLQGLWLRFHNKLVHDAGKSPNFDHIQAQVRKTYQYLVIHDFLPRIVSSSVLDKYRVNGVYQLDRMQFFKGFKTPFMPVEFSVAAYRLGHSMVRPGYRLNDAVIQPIFPVEKTVAPNLPEGLTGFRRMISDWGLDWGRFIDTEVRDFGSEDDFNNNPKQTTLANARRLQFAYRIDTALVEPLRRLPDSVADDEPNSLAARNLFRGREFGLPTGQEMADKMHLNVDVLPDAEILIGQALDKFGKDDKKPVAITEIDPAFKGKCPLWAYVLAEAMQHKTEIHIPASPGRVVKTPQLGPVGGTLVAEVFLGLMFFDEMSYLYDQSWHPGGHERFRLKDFVNLALSYSPS